MSIVWGMYNILLSLDCILCRMKKLNDLNYYTRIKNLDKKVKRIFNEVDPYGEENWEE
jgi:hypothetical protein